MDRGAFMSAWRDASRWNRDNPDARRGLLVGQAAPRNPLHGSGHALLPFPSNCAGERLHRMSGWTLHDWLTRFERFNTIEHFPGGAASGKGDAFPRKLAKECAQRQFAERRMWSQVVLFVGKANAECYGWDAEKLPEPLVLHPQRGGGHWMWMPHTSGIVQFWNDEANRAQLRLALEGVRQIIFAE